ncbi:MAG: TIGR02206 family membrane protein [Chloroflexota bacterium]
MEGFFSKEYSGPPFELFGAAHLMALGIIALIGLSFFVTRKMWSENGKRNFRYFMAGWLVLWEGSWHAWNIYYGTWTVQTMLPLHMCSVLIWSSAYMLIKKNYTIYEIAYFLGIGGALQALLTPDVGNYALPHFRALQTMCSHGGLVLATLFMTVVEGYRPTLQSFKRVMIWANVYMVFIFFLNLAIGSNYLFISHKPEFPTLIDMLAPWPWYILQLEVIAFVILGVMYIPFLVKDWRTRTQTATQA